MRYNYLLIIFLLAFVCVSCDDDDDTDSGTTRIQYNLDLATIDSFLSGEGITPENLLPLKWQWRCYRDCLDASQDMLDFLDV